MNSRALIFLGIAFAFLLAIDLYAFKGIRLITENSKTIYKQLSTLLFWLESIGIYMAIGWMVLNMDKFRDPAFTNTIFTINAFILMSLATKLVFNIFHGADDLAFLGNRLVHFFSNGSSDSVNSNGTPISRTKFLTLLGAGLATVPLGAFAYGLTKGRFNFRVIRKSLSFPNLPDAFDGLKVIHISDIHIGSFPKGHDSVAKAVKMINDRNPDVIFFTGDLVNNYASETDGWVEVFKQLKAKKGMYSILGNHDYGDYVQWNSPADKKANLDLVKQRNRDMGFDLLLNENRTLEIEGEKIGILGVENWGLRPFPQFGDINKANAGLESIPFKILLSHDPSHWDAQVLDHKDMDLTLAGHTHGMQFGIEIPGIKWSPVQYKYPRWAGLYEKGKQKLYVNRGFGYHAYAGRIGMDPEITEITLRKEATA
ncbi:metallophosphoesterase [Flammeovirga sp. EKP202]|uniref:metallophosphoesterase n=1 Tax=Flammeovirga sp. EKP202 TaxID=2770592 RepID=UPI00165F7D9A|nr:metallophosphoesterase [Flammeovirga sp. EKP202]MBD0403801.1 metallophosphoesterase [Flammeovirga sp. EKP202]